MGIRWKYMAKVKAPTVDKKITDATFLNKDGKNIKLSDVISQNDCWFVERENRHALAHRAIKKIADVAGISKSYDVQESPTVIPSYRNELEHIVRVTIKCLAKKHKKGCVHNELEKTMTVTGEANRINTPVLGRGYLRKMAEKRAYDLAVLEHLNLHTTTFSEEESETMLGRKIDDVQSVSIMSTDLEFLREDINAILLSKDTKELNDVIVEVLKKRDMKRYSPVQFSFLDKMIENKKNEFTRPGETKESLF